MPGAALNNVTTTTFNEADPYAVATDFFASIDWGDGSTSAGAVANGPAAALRRPVPTFTPKPAASP